MPRAALFTLLVVSFLSGPLEAQRAGGGFHGSAAGPHFRRGFVGQRGSGVSSRPGLVPSRLHRRNNFGSYFLAYGDSLDNDLPRYDLTGYEEPDGEAATNTAPPLRIPRTPAPLPRSQFIEIPSAANAAAAKMPPPAVFILANGERLETRRFLLSATLLSLSIDRQQRNVPLAMVDIHATLSANHDRGIDLRIPDDRNEVSLGF
jgi:hypothetical protein